MTTPFLAASAIQMSSTESTLPTPIVNMWQFRVLGDTERLMFSNGVGWIDVTDQILGSAPVTSVNALIGDVVLDSDSISEGVTNRYFTNSRADARINTQKGVVNGIASLDASGIIPTSQLPPLAITSTFVVASQAAMLALTAQEGDVAVRTDQSRSYILSTNSPSTLVDWKELLTPADAVLSVNGQTGVVSLLTTNITEGTNLYYTSARFDTRFGTKSTTDLSEGTNLYYTDERVDDRVAALIQNGTGLTWTYNDVANTLTGNLTIATTPSTPSRTLNSNFTPNATKAVFVCYTIEISCDATLIGGQSGTVDLRSDTNATPTTVRCQVQNLNAVLLGVGVTMRNTQRVCLSYIVPAGHNVRLVSASVGSPTISIVQQSEVVIG